MVANLEETTVDEMTEANPTPGSENPPPGSSDPAPGSSDLQPNESVAGIDEPEVLTEEQHALLVTAMCAVLCIDPSGSAEALFSAEDFVQRIIDAPEKFFEFSTVMMSSPTEWEGLFREHLLSRKPEVALPEPEPVALQPPPPPAHIGGDFGS